MDFETIVGYFIDDNEVVTYPHFSDLDKFVHLPIDGLPEEVCIDPYSVIQNVYDENMCKTILDLCKKALEEVGETCYGFITIAEGFLALNNDRTSAYLLQQGVWKATEENKIMTSIFDAEDSVWDEIL